MGQRKRKFILLIVLRSDTEPIQKNYDQFKGLSPTLFTSMFSLISINSARGTEVCAEILFTAVNVKA